MLLRVLLDKFIAYVTGDFPYATEYQTFWMAFQGAMIVRNGSNKNGQMHWFHAFVQGVVIAFAGALFTPFWLGRASTVFSNDLNLAMCILSFLIVNYLPFGMGAKLGNLFPIQLLTTSGAQLFRALGLVKFVHVAHDTFKDAPSSYYPTPIFGPILFGAILGNMGGFFWNGFHGYLEKGMPYGFQNGIFCASLYHLFVNDQGGILGQYLRKYVSPLIQLIPYYSSELHHKTLALIAVSSFMQLVAVLQMPCFLGPFFSPFTFFSNLIQKDTLVIKKQIVVVTPSSTPPVTVSSVKPLPKSANEKDTTVPRSKVPPIVEEAKLEPKKKKGKSKKVKTT